MGEAGRTGRGETFGRRRCGVGRPAHNWGDKENVSGERSKSEKVACGNQELAARVSRQKARAETVAPGAI
jgi:hypothetical protein